jgi:pilus assembly protein CpaB
VKRRMIGLLTSVALAVFGTVVLVGYVQSAHDKAEAGEATVPVLVVTKQIPRGTKASDLKGKVEVKQVPKGDKVDGAVSNASALDGKIAATDLLPGEQVLAERFKTSQVLGREGVPKGLLEVTVRLSPERALGGSIRAGDTVAVVSSFEPFDIAAVTGREAVEDAPTKVPNTSHVILHKVLVTAVQTTDAPDKDKPSDKDDEQDLPDPAPKNDFLVTLALDATSVQRVVFTAEFGTLWLSAEPSDAPDGQTRIETRGTVDG